MTSSTKPRPPRQKRFVTCGRYKVRIPNRVWSDRKHKDILRLDTTGRSPNQEQSVHVGQTFFLNIRSEVFFTINNSKESKYNELLVLEQEQPTESNHVMQKVSKKKQSFTKEDPIAERQEERFL